MALIPASGTRPLVFGLSLCVFEKRDYAQVVVPQMLDLKFRWWGRDMVVLHEAESLSRQRKVTAELAAAAGAAAVFGVALEAVAAAFR